MLRWSSLVLSASAALGSPSVAAQRFDEVVFRTGFENFVCSNGVIEDAETCDDGGAAAGDGCSDRCVVEFGNYCQGAPSICVAVCNDGFRASSEACDDGNGTGGDGCNATCAVESGFACTGTPSVCTTTCGDGLLVGGEMCDDANGNPGDGCNASCAIESGFGCAGTPSVCTTTCGDGLLVGAETCDDANGNAGDGCSASCAVESGFGCTSQPSVCSTNCGDGIVAGAEPCDDGNRDETDGCTTQCRIGRVCTATALPGADRFAVDPGNGRCYASYEDEMTSFPSANAACTTAGGAAGGTLATLTSPGEAALVDTVRNPTQNSWIGASDAAVEGTFAWVTAEPFAFTRFAAGEPDNDVALGGNGDCLHLGNAAGDWADTACNANTFVTGRLCEFVP